MIEPRFIESDNPLEERLGKAFFEELPTDPGVYKMYGSTSQLLYVGKAKNLRRRLFTYRRVTSSNKSRKTKRLVRMITNIDYEICATEEAALLKENELIREYRPEFNRAKKSPETYYFISLMPSEDKWTFQLGMNKPNKNSILEHTYGAFKGQRTVRKGTGALLRQLYLLEHGVQTLFDYPTVLTNKLTPLGYTLPVNSKYSIQPKIQEAIESYLNGASLQFLELLVNEVSRRGLLSEYVGRLILKDCESMKWLYDKCCHKNYQIKQLLNINQSLIPQKKLDDYLIKIAFMKKDSG